MNRRTRMRSGKSLCAALLAVAPAVVESRSRGSDGSARGVCTWHL